MKKSKFTEAQIVFAIKQSDNGVSVADAFRKKRISKATIKGDRANVIPINILKKTQQNR